jgi:hypothetical protein
MGTESRKSEFEETHVQPATEHFGVRANATAEDLPRKLAGQPMSREEALAMRGARALVDLPED